MKIYAVNGSPTMKKGMTHVLLENFLNGASDAGAEVESQFLQVKNIGYCTGCMSCWLKTPGRCVQKDDMGEILERIRKADYFVVATPVYADGMSAQTKTLVDRTVPLVSPYFELVDGHCRHKTRNEHMAQVVLLSVCGFPEMDNFGALVDHVSRWAKNMRTHFVGAVLRPLSPSLSWDEFMPEESKRIKDAIKEAGRELVKRGSFSGDVLEEIAKMEIPKENVVETANLFFDKSIEQGRKLPTDPRSWVE